MKHGLWIMRVIDLWAVQIADRMQLKSNCSASLTLRETKMGVRKGREPSNRNRWPYKRSLVKDNTIEYSTWTLSKNE